MFVKRLWERGEGGRGKGDDEGKCFSGIWARAMHFPAGIIRGCQVSIPREMWTAGWHLTEEAARNSLVLPPRLANLPD